jgi:hypothetical protein
MDTKELIEFCFYNEQAIKQAVYEKREDGCVPKTGGGSGHCKISDTTANKAITNVMPVPVVLVEYGIAYNGKRDTFALKNPEQWLKVVEWTREQYADTQRGDIMKARYVDGERRFVTAKRLGISTQLYSVMLTDLLTFAKGLAIGMGILSPKH